MTTTDARATHEVPLGECADLWLLRESEVDAAVAEYGVMGLISGSERSRHERLRGARARRLHLGARMLVRFVLAAYTGSAPERLRFETGPYGRPELVPNPFGLHFNLSHTTGLIGCVLTREQRCGVDVEQTPPPHDVARAILQFLAAEEQAQVAARPQAEQDLAVLDYWVLKEAYLKALGVGFTRSMSSFVMRGLPGPTITVDDPAGGGSTWQLELRQLPTDHRIAVALAHPQGVVERTPIRILDFAAFLRAATPHEPTTAPLPGGGGSGGSGLGGSGSGGSGFATPPTAAGLPQLPPLPPLPPMPPSWPPPAAAGT